jgi:hypothetical protein
MAEIRENAGFRWTTSRTRAALALAAGKTRKEAAEEAEVSERSVYSWLDDPDFAAEVDRLSVMTDVASRAERLRIAKRVVRQFVKDEKITTEKDLLDWLKFAQSETDGIKLDIAKQLAALGADEASVAD